MARNDSNTDTSDGANLRGGSVRVSRSRGALSGIVLVVLGAWGALIPFIGPYFNFSYTPDDPWHWTVARFWLEVLPGGAAFLGGLLLLLSANRVALGLGAWLGVAGGAWFVIDRDVQTWFGIGSPGVPAGSSQAVRAIESLALFSALGAVILFFAASAFGRTSVHSVRDVRSAQRRTERDQAKHDQHSDQVQARRSDYEDGRRDGLAEAQAARRPSDGAAPATDDSVRSTESTTERHTS